MARIKNRRFGRLIRHKRIRKKISGTPEVPRLAVFKSLRHIHAQVIDDTVGHTLVSASSAERELKPKMAGKTKTEQAKLVGEIIAERALAKGIERVVFDRGGSKYHGRVKALAEAAREKGLKF